MEPVGVTMGLISCLSVVAIYFWVVRRNQQRTATESHPVI
jgi:hypothetical protein